MANTNKEALAEIEAALEQIRQRCSAGPPGRLKAAIDQTVARLAGHVEGVEEASGELQRLLQSAEKPPDESPEETLMASAAEEVQSARIRSRQMEEAVSGLKETLAEYDGDPEIARLYEVLMKRIGASRKSITSVEKALIAFRNRLMAYGLAHRGDSEA